MSSQTDKPESDQSPSKNPPIKEESLRVRIDSDTMQQSKEKAARMGWSLGSVVRALLKLWIEEDTISSADVGTAASRAPRGKKKHPKGAVTKQKKKGQSTKK